MIELTKCPCCGNSSFDFVIKCIDFTVSKEGFSIVSCNKCNLKFTNPRPDENSLSKYYESDDYISHSDTNKGLVNKLYHIVKKQAIQRKNALVSSFAGKNKKLLDIGCGTGDFLGSLKNNGWAVIGIEPNKNARNKAIKMHDVTVLEESEIKSLETNTFSIVTMWHVLEHVSDIKKRIHEIYSLLEKGGHAIIAVPNHTSWDSKYYKEFWAAYDVPRHLSHFSPLVLKTLFAENNFSWIKSLPMKMDAFYVSMLSEKYKKSTFGIVKAFFVGLTSNLKAKNDAEKYSSVIYIFQKK